MAGILSSVREALKAATFVYGRSRGGYGNSSNTYGWPRFDNLTDPWPRTIFNSARDDFDPATSAGNIADNSAVVICLGKIADVFPKPRLQVVELDTEGNWQPVEDHPALDLLAEPNALHDFGSLSTAWAMAYLVDGNSYFVLTRSRGGSIKQIDYVPPSQMLPQSENPAVAVERYLYSVEGRQIPYAPEDVIHWRMGQDPTDPRLGQSRLKRLVSEVAADNEASSYTAAILHNMGIVGGILTVEDPEDAQLMDADKAKKIKQHWKDATTGKHRGGLVVPTFRAKYQDVGRSPQEMALGDIRVAPEARIAAVLGVPLMVAGLPGGAESKSYANYAEAREAFWEETIEPLQDRFCSGLTRYLLPQFGDTIRGPRRRRFRYSYDEVRAFQPDLDKLSARKVKEWMADGITLDELREAIGEKAKGEAEGQVYYSQHTAALKPEPAPMPTDPNADLPADTAQNAAERTPPFGAKKSVVVDEDGMEYVTTDRDLMQVARGAFGSLDAFWEKRSERWRGMLEEE